MSVDIISQFSGYAGAKPGLNRKIENSSELQIAKKYSDLSDEIGKLRLNTIASTHVDKSGNLKVTQTPGLTALQARIAEKEQALEKLIQIANKINRLLEDNDVSSIVDLHEKRKELASIIESRPFRAWDLFKLTRGEGKTKPGEVRVYWLPSDIAQVPEYKVEEDRIRSELAAAKAAIEPIQKDLASLDALVSEAGTI